MTGELNPDGLDIIPNVGAGRAAAPAADKPMPAVPQVVLDLPEVTDVVIREEDACIYLQWTVPVSADTVIVRRRANLEIQRIVDGEKVMEGLQSQVKDVGLTNGTQYHYRIFAVYPTHDGGLAHSKGRSVRGTPREKPAPVRSLHIQRSGADTVVSWSHATEEDVRILQSPASPRVTPGEMLPRAEAEALGAYLQNTSDHSAVDRSAPEGLRYYTPVSFRRDLAAVGTPHRFVRLAEVTNFRLAWQERRILAQWDWPAGATVAQVVWTTGVFPITPNQPAATSRIISRTEYEAANGCRLDAPRRMATHFAVFAGIATAEGELYTTASQPGARATLAWAQQTPISYFVTSHFGRKRLLISATGKCRVNLVVVGRAGRQPLRPEDGTEIVRLIGLDLSTTPTSVDLPALSRGEVFRLFHAREIDNERCPLNHPPVKDRR